MKKISSAYSRFKNRPKGSNPLRRHPFIGMSVLSVFLFFMAAGGLVMVNAQSVGPNDVKIVDIWQDGQTRSLPTRAQSVGELIERLEINLAEQDVVEPSLDTPITDDDFQVSIFEAKPVSIRDNQEVRYLQSAYQEPRTIVEHAGYELYPEDNVIWASADELLENITDLSPRVVIERANVYSINLYGDVFESRSQSSEVSEILNNLGVTLNEDDEITPSGSVENGAEIVIARFGTSIETIEETVEFTINSTDDPSKELGTTTVTKAGVDGRKTVTYEIEYENDIEIGRKILQEVVTKQPVAQEQTRGTKPPAVNTNVSGDKQFLMAAAGIAESDWGYVDHIITKESGWRHLVSGPQTSIGRAYGLCQSLPASKMASAGPDWRTNPVTQLRWCSGYANGRYGGWSGAYSFWLANSWW